MLRKSFAFILLILMTCAVTFAQDETPESKDKKAEKARPELSRVYTLFGGGSYLGVRTKEVTKENFAKFGLNRVQGVAVENVLKDTPAAKAGLQYGDVITRFNGEAVTSTRKLTRLISEVAADHTADLTILRNGTEQNLSVTMGRSPGARVFNGTFNMPNVKIPEIPDFEMPNVEIPDIEIPEGIYDLERLQDGKDKNRLLWNFGSNRLIGVGVSSLNKQLGDYFGVASGNGLLINNVAKDSPAEKAGLKAGDVIVEVDGQEVKNSFDLIRRINDKKEGDVNLTIIRDKSRQTISVTPEKRKGKKTLNQVYFGELGRTNAEIKEGIEKPVSPKIFIIEPAEKLKLKNAPVIVDK
jgi:serine protease Do